MIYESTFKGYGITMESHRIQFHPSVDWIDEHGRPKGGEIDTGSGNARRESNLDEAQMNGVIEAQDDFKRGIPGTRGIWKKEDRLGVIAKAQKSQAQALAYQELDEDVLRVILAKRNIAVPVNASKGELVALALGTKAPQPDAETAGEKPVKKIKAGAKPAE